MQNVQANTNGGNVSNSTYKDNRTLLNGKYLERLSCEGRICWIFYQLTIIRRDNIDLNATIALALVCCIVTTNRLGLTKAFSD